MGVACTVSIQLPGHSSLQCHLENNICKSDFMMIKSIQIHRYIIILRYLDKCEEWWDANDKQARQPAMTSWIWTCLSKASKNKFLWIHLFFYSWLNWMHHWLPIPPPSPPPPLLLLVQYLTILQYHLLACQFVFSTCFLSSTTGDTAHLIRNILTLLLYVIFEMLGKEIKQK